MGGGRNRQGLGVAPIGQAVDGRQGQGFSPNGGSPDFQRAFAQMTAANEDSGIARADPLSALIGKAPKRNKGGIADVLATALAIAADATDPQGRGIATQRLAGQWGKRSEGYEQALSAFRNRAQIAGLPGMTEREMSAYLANPEAWGSNMSRAATSRYDAATLNPGDQRFLGEGNGVYQAPTRGQQYAQALRLTPGTEAYEKAIRDQEMGAHGPTAFQNDIALEDHKTGNHVRLEQVRQSGRVSLEGVRQGNRVTLRGAPRTRDGNTTSRRSNKTPAVPTATDAKGNTIYYRNGVWVDTRGLAVQ